MNVIDWAERTYLVPDLDMLAFFNAVNLGHEQHRLTSQFLCTNSEAPVHGLPTVSEPNAKYLLDRPLEVTLDAGLPATAQHGTLESDGLAIDYLLGRPDRPEAVFVGMELGPVFPILRATVTDISRIDKSIAVRVEYFVEDRPMLTQAQGSAQEPLVLSSHALSASLP